VFAANEHHAETRCASDCREPRAAVIACWCVRRSCCATHRTVEGLSLHRIHLNSLPKHWTTRCWLCNSDVDSAANSQVFSRHSLTNNSIAGVIDRAR